MNQMDSARLEELLDWLAEAVARRLEPALAPHCSASRSSAGEASYGRAGSGAATPPQTEMTASGIGEDNGDALAGAPAWVAVVEDASSTTATVEPAESAAVGDARPPVVLAGGAEDELLPVPAAQTAGLPAHAAQLLGRLTVGLLIAVILINIPWLPHGTALARMIPSTASLIVRNGLLVKESDRPDVYVYQDGKFRWITDLEAFHTYGFQWKNVHQVEPGFLAGYPIGNPLSVVAKCTDSPHIYQLQNGAKHWIVDIPAFTEAGYQWSDVQFMDCAALRALPTGETIPPGLQPAPKP